MQLAGKSRLSTFGRARVCFRQNGKLRQYALSRNSFAGGDSLEETAPQEGQLGRPRGKQKQKPKIPWQRNQAAKGQKTVAAKHGTKVRPR